MPTDSIVAVRRSVHKQLLRGLEGISGLAAWAADNDTGAVPLSTELHGPARAKFYARWVEMQAIASSIDSNLENDTHWATLLAEASIPGRFWYVHYKLSLPGNMQDDVWSFWLPDDRSGWVFYQTTGPETGATATTPNSYTGAARGVSMTPATGFSWVLYLTE